MDLNNISNVSIIPFPVRITPISGRFVLTSDTIIHTDLRLEKIGEYLNNLLNKATGINFSRIVADLAKENNAIIILKIDPKLEYLGREGYILQVTNKKIIISALSPSGVFYGVQTLRQLLPIEIESRSKVNNIEWSVPCVEIEDYPRFVWRGYMLDEGRHFLGKDIVMRMLDLMALLKLNVFHWHLTEDQGWRIEIKKYPRLIEIGSKRKESQIGGFQSIDTDTIPHEGYYTQEDIKEIISYATERFIKVVPEIDIPGHSMAALAAYPELSCTGGPFEVSTMFGIKEDVYCVGKEKVFKFIQDVLNEVMELFPSDIIHIGGDEVPLARWKECPDCQVRMKNEGFKDERELQIYFTNRIAQYISSRGRKAMGWNEILNEKLVKNVIGQHWMGNFKHIHGYMKKGRKMVMSKFGQVYLDYDYHFTSLKKSYRYDPIRKTLEEELHENVLGIEGPLWTEWVPNVERLDWQTFPRLIAIAETGWTPKNSKDYQFFRTRLDSFLTRLDILGVNYAKLEEVDPPRKK